MTQIERFLQGEPIGRVPVMLNPGRYAAAWARHPSDAPAPGSATVDDQIGFHRVFPNDGVAYVDITGPNMLPEFHAASQPRRMIHDSRDMGEVLTPLLKIMRRNRVRMVDLNEIECVRLRHAALLPAVELPAAFRLAGRADPECIAEIEECLPAAYRFYMDQAQALNLELIPHLIGIGLAWFYAGEMDFARTPRSVVEEAVVPHQRAYGDAVREYGRFTELAVRAFDGSRWQADALNETAPTVVHLLDAAPADLTAWREALAPQILLKGGGVGAWGDWIHEQPRGVIVGNAGREIPLHTPPGELAAALAALAS